MPPIGFRPLDRHWEGPVVLNFSLYGKHSRTARYKAKLEARVFDLYAPLFMLEGLAANEVPPKLVALIGKAPETIKVLGLAQGDYRPRIDSDVCEYMFTRECVNSLRYDFRRGDQTYALYVPMEIFGDDAPPHAVYLRLGVPAEP